MASVAVDYYRVQDSYTFNQSGELGEAMAGIIMPLRGLEAVITKHRGSSFYLLPYQRVISYDM